MPLDSNPTASGPGVPRELVDLDPDHPGFRDPEYRARRNAIARAAMEHRPGEPVPRVDYSEAEHEVWAQVWDHLAEEHRQRACQPVQRLAAVLGLDRRRIPQLADLNRTLTAATGFTMEPVAGLVQARAFLAFLGRRVFLSTQYVRHPSRPLYTPEPDVIHELVGHAATLVHPGIALLNEQLGRAAAKASETEMRRLERVYWHTLEFGAVEEAGSVRAFGAGLLSSLGEIRRFATEAELLAWDLARMAGTPYDPTDYQPRIFVAPSFDRMLLDLAAWTAGGRWRDSQGPSPAPRATRAQK